MQTPQWSGNNGGSVDVLRSTVTRAATATGSMVLAAPGNGARVALRVCLGADYDPAASVPTMTVGVRVGG